MARLQNQQAEWRTPDRLSPRDLVFVPSIRRWTTYRYQKRRDGGALLVTDFGEFIVPRGELLRVVPGESARPRRYQNPIAAALLALSRLASE